MSDHHLFRLMGEIKRAVARIDERTEEMAVNEQEVQQSLEGLKNDLSTKLGEISSEVQAIEQASSSGAQPDLTALKDLVDGLDQTVQGFQLPTSTSTSGSGGTTTEGSSGGGTPTGEGGAPASKPLYKHNGEGPIDSTQWTPASVTAEDGSQLFEFAGDTAGGSPTGASAEWESYTGATQAAGPSGV